MANTDDIIVFDVEFQNAAKDLKGYCDALTKLIDSYVGNINTILTQAIQDEIISSNLNNMAIQVGALKGEIAAEGLKMQRACKMYISEIDEADDFLY